MTKVLSLIGGAAVRKRRPNDSAGGTGKKPREDSNPWFLTTFDDGWGYAKFFMEDSKGNVAYEIYSTASGNEFYIHRLNSRLLPRLLPDEFSKLFKYTQKDAIIRDPVPNPKLVVPNPTEIEINEYLDQFKGQAILRESTKIADHLKKNNQNFVFVDPENNYHATSLDVIRKRIFHNYQWYGELGRRTTAKVEKWKEFNDQGERNLFWYQMYYPFESPDTTTGRFKVHYNNPYIKLMRYFVEKPQWFINGNPPGSRVYKLFKKPNEPERNIIPNFSFDDRLEVYSGVDTYELMELFPLSADPPPQEFDSIHKLKSHFKELQR